MSDTGRSYCANFVCLFFKWVDKKCNFRWMHFSDPPNILLILFSFLRLQFRFIFYKTKSWQWVNKSHCHKHWEWNSRLRVLDSSCDVADVSLLHLTHTVLILSMKSQDFALLHDGGIGVDLRIAVKNISCATVFFQTSWNESNDITKFGLEN